MISRDRAVQDQSEGSDVPELTYSAGDSQPCWHDEYGRLDFPRGQKLYGRNWSLVVTDLAADFHGNHDGWEAVWPLEFRIYEDGTEVARFSVEREHEPVFTQWAVEMPEVDGTSEPTGKVPGGTQ